MFNLIRVELKDGAICRMVPRALNIFLAQDKVVKFERSDGWAVVGVDPLRDMKADRNYSGFEHRMAV
jgi:hypothetical protein